MKSAAIFSILFVVLMSLVAAADPALRTEAAINNDAVYHTAETLKTMLASNPETKNQYASVSTEDLFGFLRGALSAAPSLISGVSNIVSSAASGDTSGIARNVLGLVGNVVPALAGAIPGAGAAAPMLGGGEAPTSS